MVFCLPKIPKSYLILVLLLGMIILAILGIDSWTHATIGLLVGYLLKNEERTK